MSRGFYTIPRGHVEDDGFDLAVVQLDLNGEAFVEREAGEIGIAERRSDANAAADCRAGIGRYDCAVVENDTAVRRAAVAFDYDVLFADRRRYVVAVGRAVEHAKLRRHSGLLKPSGVSV